MSSVSGEPRRPYTPRVVLTIDESGNLHSELHTDLIQEFLSKKLLALRAEDPNYRSVPAAPDKGPWNIFKDSDGVVIGILSNDDDDDVMLRPDGNFADDEHKQKFLTELAAWMNYWLHVHATQGVNVKSESAEVSNLQSTLRQQKRLEAYQKAINRIDDRIEYRSMDTARTDIQQILSELTDDLKDTVLNNTPNNKPDQL